MVNLWAGMEDDPHHNGMEDDPHHRGGQAVTAVTHSGGHGVECVTGRGQGVESLQRATGMLQEGFPARCTPPVVARLMRRAMVSLPLAPPPSLAPFPSFPALPSSPAEPAPQA